MAIGAALGFWAMSALLVLVPGADWAYVIAAGLRDRTVWPAVSGLLLGYPALTAVVAAGVAALVARTPAVLTALTFTGAGYLIWLGAGVLARPPAVAVVSAFSAASAGRAVVRGFGVSGLNPKGLLLFLALLPQFTECCSWPCCRSSPSRAGVGPWQRRSPCSACCTRPTAAPVTSGSGRWPGRCCGRARPPPG